MADLRPNLLFTHNKKQILSILPWNSAPPALDSVVEHWGLETLKELQLKHFQIMYPILYFHIQLLSDIIRYGSTNHSGLRHNLK